MTGLMSRNKGKRGEREVKVLFKTLFAEHDIRRNHQQAEQGGADLVDVPYFSVEVKLVQAVPWGKALDDWWDQCCAQATDEGKDPCLVFRQNRGQWFVMVWNYGAHFGEEYVLVRTIMLWRDFAAYIQEVYGDHLGSL
jgi:hypothetical protein